MTPFFKTLSLPSAFPSVALFLVLFLIPTFHPTLGYHCYQCQTLSATSLRTPPTPPPDDDATTTLPPTPTESSNNSIPTCEEFAGYELKESSEFETFIENKIETNFSLECQKYGDACVLGVGISLGVDKSGAEFQLGFEYRGCFNNAKNYSVTDLTPGKCLYGVPFHKLFGKVGEDFLTENGLMVDSSSPPSEEGGGGTMHVCACDAALCNLDSNKVFYYPDHIKWQEGEEKRIANLKDGHEHGRARAKGNSIVVGLWKMETLWIWGMTSLSYLGI